MIMLSQEGQGSPTHPRSWGKAWDGVSLVASEGATCRHLDLTLVASMLCENLILLSEPLIPWILTVAAPGSGYRQDIQSCLCPS